MSTAAATAIPASASASASTSASAPPPQALPATHRALICDGPGQRLHVETIHVPLPTEGSLTALILAANVEPNTAALLGGQVPALHFPSPFIPGARAIARVAATGPDTTTLAVGQLVLLDPFVRARDNPDAAILWGAGMFGADPAAKTLLEGCWRHGMCAEYVRAPLENCYALDEARLCGAPADGGLAYSLEDLTFLTRQLVSYGGLRGIDLKAGETVIVAPATGGYSSAAVGVAVAMGAKVIAVGRNLAVLRQMAAIHGPRVSIVPLKGNVEEDLASISKLGPVDAYIDISPGVASDSTHVRSCIMAVKPYGRVSLMGVIHKDIAIPYVMAVLKNLTIRGQYMYEKEHARGIIKLAEAGVLKLGKSAGHTIVASFSLEEFEKALEVAKNSPHAGQVIVIKP